MSEDQCSYCNGSEAHELWVQCGKCPQWVHVRCIPIQFTTSEDYPIKSSEVVQFICTKHGGDPILTVKSKKRRKMPLVNEGKKPQRYSLRAKGQIDYITLNEGQDVRLRSKHPHIDPFLRCFEKWRSVDETISSEQLLKLFPSVTTPLKVNDPAHSGMKVPPLDVAILTKIVGEDHVVDVMDVQSQQNERWTMKQWNDYYTNTPAKDRDRIRNVISFEVSGIPELGKGIQRPTVVDVNDLADLVWPETYDENVGDPPKVKKYILMSVANAYTDFHLDFSGTSVYYNILKGSKKFILFPPTDSNLAEYKRWCDDDNQSLIFLGDRLDKGVAYELTAGDLFMIPAGYIHAVYTPEDSFIVGGNYLSLRDLTTHIKIVKIEQETHVPKKFTFPKFEIVMGRTCEWLLKDESRVEKTGIDHVQSLIRYLRDPKVKYKPTDYKTKWTMIKKLNDIVDNKATAATKKSN
ncbi:HCL142Cp [Eremothecium sinecaudum]|uniref:JmjC domain-containing histone demethylation protein 1 n=1 Tax=Eremothecium sinecaudum TaxID=45286 RepID=A0A0X8HRB0_9SACH|nr:HCL142Cp [Eremothecium sinecaudum]AMD20009.1 HCL142Cp [Eremothecium sinecaudum]